MRDKSKAKAESELRELRDQARDESKQEKKANDITAARKMSRSSERQKQSISHLFLWHCCIGRDLLEKSDERG